MPKGPVEETIPRIVPKEAWDREFGLKRAIPSSMRTEPAKALQLFREILGLGPSVKVLDVGGGNGRNTIYLARLGCDVTTIDSSEVALREIRRRVTEARLTHQVSIVQQSLDSPLTFSDDSFDFVFDGYVFCHFLADEVRQEFWQDMRRVTKPGGHLLSIVFSDEDEYYARLVGGSPDQRFVRDPANGIWKRLYSELEIKNFLSSYFELTYFAKFEFSDVVLGQEYRRVVLTSVLKKRS